MRKLVALGALVLTVGTVQAQGWVDVDRTGVISRGGIYCTSEENLLGFGAYAKDGDAAGADRMVAEGKCMIIQNSMRATVIQENDFLASFISPSGKAFWTFKEMIK